jgi:hypothetical protein
VNVFVVTCQLFSRISLRSFSGYQLTKIGGLSVVR